MIGNLRSDQEAAMPEKKKLATASAKVKKITKSGTAELTEDQLDDVSGGADYTASTQKVQKVRKQKVSTDQLKGLHNSLDSCWIVR